MGKVTRRRPDEIKLDRLLKALEQELVDVPDEEILDAARSLGMNPQMKESALYAGLRFPASIALDDWFDLEALRRARLEHDARRALGGPSSGAKRNGDADA